MMMIDGKTFRNKKSGEYEKNHLKNPIQINSFVVEQDLWQRRWEVLQIWMDCTDIPHSYERNSFQLGQHYSQVFVYHYQGIPGRSAP